MNFSKLLATGKSMIGMRDTHSPYRMRTENLLPKFESAKNPFAPASKAASPIAAPKTDTFVAVETPLAEATVAPIAKPAISTMETNFLFDDQLQPAVVPIVVHEAEPVPAIPAPAKVEAKLVIPVVLNSKTETPELAPVAKPAPVSEPKPALFSALMKKANPLAYLPSREAAKPARVRTAVQTELSLERVKVMRNDLSDTDLEVIPAKLAGKPEAPAARLQPVARTEETTLSRLTSRFFGAGQIQT
jgi:hypothetical protein